MSVPPRVEDYDYFNSTMDEYDSLRSLPAERLTSYERKRLVVIYDGLSQAIDPSVFRYETSEGGTP